MAWEWWEWPLRWLRELRTLRSLGAAMERSLGARRLRTSDSLPPLPPDLRPSFLLQLDPLLPAGGEREEERVRLRWI